MLSDRRRNVEAQEAHKLCMSVHNDRRLWSRLVPKGWESRQLMYSGAPTRMERRRSLLAKTTAEMFKACFMRSYDDGD